MPLWRRRPLKTLAILNQNFYSAVKQGELNMVDFDGINAMKADLEVAHKELEALLKDASTTPQQLNDFCAGLEKRPSMDQIMKFLESGNLEKPKSPLTPHEIDKTMDVVMAHPLARMMLSMNNVLGNLVIDFHNNIREAAKRTSG